VYFGTVSMFAFNRIWYNVHVLLYGLFNKETLYGGTEENHGRPPIYMPWSKPDTSRVRRKMVPICPWRSPHLLLILTSSVRLVTEVNVRQTKSIYLLVENEDSCVTNNGNVSLCTILRLFRSPVIVAVCCPTTDDLLDALLVIFSTSFSNRMFRSMNCYCDL
jgi:hypothetical protein